MADLDLTPIRALLAAAHPADAHMSCADCCAMARTRTALAEAVPGLVEEVERLVGRRDALLAQVARLSQEVPLESEVREALEQRGALVAEVGTLRARVADVERQRDEARAEAARQRAAIDYLGHYIDGYDTLKEIADDIAAGREPIP